MSLQSDNDEEEHAMAAVEEVNITEEEIKKLLDITKEELDKLGEQIIKPKIIRVMYFFQ